MGRKHKPSADERTAPADSTVSEPTGCDEALVDAQNEARLRAFIDVIPLDMDEEFGHPWERWVCGIEGYTSDESAEDEVSVLSYLLGKFRVDDRGQYKTHPPDPNKGLHRRWFPASDETIVEDSNCDDVQKVKKAVARLKRRGFIESRAGSFEKKHVRFYHLNWDRILQALIEYVDAEDPPDAEEAQPERYGTLACPDAQDEARFRSYFWSIPAYFHHGLDVSGSDWPKWICGSGIEGRDETWVLLCLYMKFGVDRKGNYQTSPPDVQQGLLRRWLALPFQAITTETHLDPRYVREAVDRLENKGFIEASLLPLGKQQVPHFQIHWDRLLQAVVRYVRDPATEARGAKDTAQKLGTKRP